VNVILTTNPLRLKKLANIIHAKFKSDEIEIPECYVLMKTKRVSGRISENHAFFNLFSEICILAMGNMSTIIALWH
jgi:hypothetical protein